MPEPIVRKQVGLRLRAWKEVEGYRFAEKIGSESEAIRRLVDLGLKAKEVAAHATTA